jgi:prophage antirepressor-like protein
VEVINEEPWFVAKDVCDLLGLDDTRRAVERLDDDEKIRGVILHSGQNRNVWMVNESGLYNLIIRSNKPQASAFRKWVTSEVLPSIRQTGEYVVADNKPASEIRQQHKSAEVKHLLFAIKGFISRDDMQKIARKLDVSESRVVNVLRGESYSIQVLSALYERALDVSSKNPYTHPVQFMNRLLGTV